MRLILIAIGSVTILVGLPLTSFAQSWKGIYPLKTTRAEVIKRLGVRKEIDELGRAVFSSDDGTIRISWKRPNCFSKGTVLETEADDDALVYQITLEPISEIKSIESYKPPDPPVKATNDRKDGFNDWISQDVDCVSGQDSQSCSFMGDGFGYSTSSKLGITAIYYYPTHEEEVAFRVHCAFSVHAQLIDVSYKALRVGSPAADVYNILGKPLSTQTHGVNPCGGNWTILSYRGAIVTLDKSGSQNDVVRLEVTSAKWNIGPGITIGASRQEVLRRMATGPGVLATSAEQKIVYLDGDGSVSLLFSNGKLVEATKEENLC
jgi:hypothetical protein